MHSKKSVNDSKSFDQARAGRLFHLASLGCKVNQAELAYLASELEKKGWARAEDPAQADLAILMTCSVTAGAARQSRQMTRRLAKACPKAVILATGCDVQAEPRAYTKENAIILGRSRLVELPLMAAGEKPWPDQSQAPDAPDQGLFCPGVREPGNGRSRALLKVQDGCNAFCAYCIVPYTRGRPRSLPLDQALAAFRKLDQARTAEVVLTGVHLGRYGLDLEPKSSLTELVEALLGQNAYTRLRISSLEVNEISDRLVDLTTSHAKLCRHLHIPLQSGCDLVLKKMGRPYKTAEFARTVLELHEKSPDICLGADVLVGLPHEDEESFKRTHDLLAGLPLSYFHVFPYSPRQGTRASAMKNRTRGPEVKQRAAILRELGKEKFKSFLQTQENREFEAVVEADNKARTDNYCLVKLDEPARPGDLVKIKTQTLLEHQGQYMLGGKILSQRPFICL
ncbi:MiaB/RimO family radical SAM methylthiotransferase [Dethiosulfatarculus sandiegensis]|uniref:Uncharacterized protein n=1 Tax=Dethiosulfatarculus sandiegensis TaxID=1429043 RepID=A0A0D2J9P0_9BACT|nr:MiaB/RimO family radical SAM methylthiotransferase [Dethiosulfatarculus sandiegensis]KIX14864.1 hypothetical protein X474_06880 [Dethiosulfatarculus sandiegensis]